MPPIDKVTTGLLFLVHAFTVLLFALVTKYGAASGLKYNQWQDIHVMVGVGFGFLMAFLYRAAFTTLGHSLVIVSIGGLWAILSGGLWFSVFKVDPVWDYIPINLRTLIDNDFCVASVLISFGAIVGRASLPQLVLMAIFEVTFYQFNAAVAFQRFFVADVGGSMIIHEFGAFFGLAVSYVLENHAPARTAASRAEAKATVASDTLSIFGTLFLFVFWPSFNAATAHANNELAVVNTFLSIAGSVVVAFVASFYFNNGKLRMVDVQNATLAGGVAMGAAADMYLEPYAAILIGSVAGLLSVVGFTYITPKVKEVFGIEDVCGILSLHGLPGVFGGIVSIIATRKATRQDWANYGGVRLEVTYPVRGALGAVWDPYVQANYQLATLATTLAIAVTGGAFTGMFMRELPSLATFFDDAEEWEIEAPAAAEAKKVE